jgi:hypothetical protein
MSAATITLEDDPSGGIAVKLTYSGGLVPNSPAHWAAHELMQHMDTLGQRAGEPVVNPVVEAAAPRLVLAQG